METQEVNDTIRKLQGTVAGAISPLRSTLRGIGRRVTPDTLNTFREAVQTLEGALNGLSDLTEMLGDLGDEVDALDAALTDIEGEFERLSTWRREYVLRAKTLLESALAGEVSDAD